MRMMNLFVSAFLVTTSTAALAQTQPPANTPPVETAAVVAKGKAVDPNKMVCRTMETTGSRLGRKRVCHTAQEWAEQQALDRREIERQQATRYNGNS